MKQQKQQLQTTNLTATTTTNNKILLTRETLPHDDIRTILSKRGKMMYACINCRKKHKYCTKDFPCSRCVQSRLDCCYLKPKKRGRPTKLISEEQQHNTLNDIAASLTENSFQPLGVFAEQEFHDTSEEDCDVEGISRYEKQVTSGKISKRRNIKVRTIKFKDATKSITESFERMSAIPPSSSNQINQNKNQFNWPQQPIQHLNLNKTTTLTNGYISDHPSFQKKYNFEYNGANFPLKTTNNSLPVHKVANTQATYNSHYTEPTTVSTLPPISELFKVCNNDQSVYDNSLIESNQSSILPTHQNAQAYYRPNSEQYLFSHNKQYLLQQSHQQLQLQAHHQCPQVYVEEQYKFNHNQHHHQLLHHHHHQTSVNSKQIGILITPPPKPASILAHQQTNFYTIPTTIPITIQQQQQLQLQQQHQESYYSTSKYENSHIPFTSSVVNHT